MYLKKYRSLILVCVFFALFSGLAAAAPSKGKILFIPHDNRPVSFEQTVATVKSLGYEVIVPPAELLGSRDDLGHPDELWKWLQKNAKRADAAVLSSDSLIYGSLVGSRKHDYTQADVLARADKFSSLRANNPKLSIYVFGSIMRSPRNGAASGTEEPSYYAKYGADIFRYTALSDKADTEKLTRSEAREYSDLEKNIPKDAINDWLGRRQKNFAASTKLIELDRQNAFTYLVFGRDDNAPYSQTHKESRLLAAKGAPLGDTKFQTVAGIDELGMVLLARAANDISHQIPLVYVRYGTGKGADTIPTYSDETIAQSVHSHLRIAGAIEVPTLKRADLVLLVNTNRNGRTYEANDADNTTVLKDNTLYFADMVSYYTGKGYHVGVGDISYANGADNALMAELSKRGLLSKLTSYAGWNTATNSTGFAIGQGIMNAQMKDENRKHLLAVRYLDDWAYQANVRQSVAGKLSTMTGVGNYGQLDAKKADVVHETADELQKFAAQKLPDFKCKSLQVDFPWNRMFEVSVDTKQ